MKNFKRLVAIVLTLTMALGLSACGGGSSSSTETPAADSSAAAESPAAEASQTAAAENPAANIEIEPVSNKSASGETDKDVYIDFWSVWPSEDHKTQYFQQMGEAFAAQYEKDTGISVAFETVPQDGYIGVAEKLTAGFVSGELPVISLVEEQQLAQFASLCTDLNGYLDQAVIDNYNEGLMHSCVRDGKMLAVPGGRSYMLLAVNMDLLAKSGHKIEDLDTWEGYRKVSQDISALGDDIYGACIYWDTDAWTWESALYSNGGSVDNEDGTKVTFNENGAGSEFMKLTLAMMKEGSCYTPYGKSSDPYADVMTRFMEGKTGTILVSPVSYGNMKAQLAESETPFEVSMTDQPGGSAGKSTTTGGSNILVGNQATETQKQVAAAFLTYLAQDENAVEWMNTSGYLLPTKSSMNCDTFKAMVEEDPNYLTICEGVQYGHARPTTSHWREMYLHITEGLEKYCMEPDKYTDEDLDAMVTEWADYCQKIIDED